MITKECLGQCANCGSDGLSYGKVVVLIQAKVYFPFVCEFCGARGKEQYNLDYTETECDEAIIPNNSII